MHVEVSNETPAAAHRSMRAQLQDFKADMRAVAGMQLCTCTPDAEEEFNAGWARLEGEVWATLTRRTVAILRAQPYPLVTTSN